MDTWTVLNGSKVFVKPLGPQYRARRSVAERGEYRIVPSRIATATARFRSTTGDESIRRNSDCTFRDFMYVTRPGEQPIDDCLNFLVPPRNCPGRRTGPISLGARVRPGTWRIFLSRVLLVAPVGRCVIARRTTPRGHGCRDRQGGGQKIYLVSSLDLVVVLTVGAT